MDMLLRFHTGVVLQKASATTVLMDGREVAQHYILKGSFVIDFLATVPSWVEVRTGHGCQWITHASAARQCRNAIS